MIMNCVKHDLFILHTYYNMYCVVKVMRRLDTCHCARVRVSIWNGKVGLMTDGGVDVQEGVWCVSVYRVCVW